MRWAGALLAGSIVLVAPVAVAFTAAASVGAGAPAVPLLTYVASNGAICLVHADGSHPVLLTTRWKGAGSPAWSPRGRYLALARGTGSGTSKIVVADARGRILWRFGSGPYNGAPLWSPDGSRIAYHWGSAHVFGLAVARANGFDDRGVASSPGFPTYGPAHPAWTPDGRRLAFDDGNFVDTPQGIFTVALDGSDRRLLVANALSPSFAPDGTKLAYIAFHYEQEHGVNEQGGLFLAHADGTDPRLLGAQTGEWPSELQWSQPAWSPDGTHLAFARDTLLYGRAVHTDLVVERVDGSGERVLASAGPSVGLSPPVWSPGGKYLAFERYASRAIVVARADGGGRRVVVARSGGGLAWRPAVALPVAKRPPCPRR
jgi:Tol biopolymer transport system component